MDKKKRNTIITIIVILLMFIGSAIYLFLNYTHDENSLTVLEKKWITDNINKIVDVNVYNDIPVYGYNGEGIIFDFLEYFTKENKINFNKISYYVDSSFQEADISFKIVNDNKLNDKDMLLYQDHYVILSNNKDSIELYNNFKLGILKKDSDISKNYFDSNIEIVEYDNIDLLMAGIKDSQVDYVLLSNLSYMDDILRNNLNIVYHVEDLKVNFIMSAKDDTVFNILKKTYNSYLDSYYERDYSINYLNAYFKSTNTSDLLQKNYNAKAYHYGYVVNMPYENYANDRFVGTILNYLEELESYTGVEIDTTIYQNVEELKSAMLSGEVDFALANFKYDKLNMNYVTTSAIKDLDYVVLSKDNYDINSLKGLKEIAVKVVDSSILHHELNSYGGKVLKYANTNELLRSIDDYSVLLIDKETYIYYKDSKLKDYNVILENTIRDGYKFILNAENEPFNSLFNYFVSTIDYQTIRYDYNTDISLDKDYTSLKIIAFIVFVVLILVLSVILMNKKNVAATVISKDEKLKYIDPMTSLKNRNYLNLNIYKWDDNVIFPQSVVVMDINKLREVNDTFGREVGDELIKKVASVLINNQLENTDIVRSGGDEFLIYMVGYEEKEVINYTKKLIKDMKDVPDSLGVEVGYSMILDEVKTVDDAINEAVTMMTKSKEKKRLKEQEDK